MYAGDTGLAQGRGRTKKEAESQAAKSALERLGDFFARLKAGANKPATEKAEKKEKLSRKEKKNKKLLAAPNNEDVCENEAQGGAHGSATEPA